MKIRAFETPFNIMLEKFENIAHFCKQNFLANKYVSGLAGTFVNRYFKISCVCSQKEKGEHINTEIQFCV